jgi:hypothetical protein
MSEGHTGSLDALAAELGAVVTRARAAAQDAALLADLETIGTEVAAATEPISEAMSVLYDSPLISLKPNEASELRRKQRSLGTQLSSFEYQFHEDPTKLRRGTVWRDARQAINQLLQELERLRDEHYQALLAPYPDDDRDHLQGLPGHTAGVDEYQKAVEAFERALTTTPRGPQSVERAVAAGERLRDCRTKIESEAIPAEFRIHWRQLRGDGLALSDLSEELRAWLSEHGIEHDVVLKLRA